MCRKNVLTIVAVAILALAIGQVQAEPVTIIVPGGDFQMYKPETGYTVTATFPGGVFDNYASGVGDNLAVKAGGIADYSDDTTGGFVDMPGWVVLQGNNDLANNGVDGSTGLNAFAAWGGDCRRETAASLGQIESGAIYTISAMVNGGVADGPLAFYLLADGVALTPSAAVEVVTPISDWQLISRTFDAGSIAGHIGESMTIVIGVQNENDLEGRMIWDNVSLSYELMFQATNPIPADKATDVCRSVVLSWAPGDYADTHDVYFGTNFNDVNDATTSDPPVYKGSQTENYYPTAGTLDLDFGQTYYWRIDEVNAAPDYTIFKGKVWQFTIEPFAYGSIAVVTVTASGSDPGSEPNNTIDLVGDLHSLSVLTDVWLSDANSPGEVWIKYEFDKVYKLHEMWVWNYNVKSGPITTKLGFRNVTIEYSTDGTDYTTLGATHEFAQATGAADYPHNTTVDFSVGAKYVRITALENWHTGPITDPDYYGLSEVRFFAMEAAATEPSPESGTTGVEPDVVLSWRSGRGVAEHDVYISENFDDVNDRSISQVIIPDDGSCRGSYGPLSLDFGKTYHWRVDEVNMAEAYTTWESDVWSFTTADHLIVDDIESYGDANTPGLPGGRIWYTWMQGYWFDNPYYYPGNGTGSSVGDWPPPVSEPNIVHGGDWSMPYSYDNDGDLYGTSVDYYSEASANTLDLPIGSKDWSKPKALSLWFYGQSGNDANEMMYVALDDGTESVGVVEYDGDMNDIKIEEWHEWNIALQDFNDQGVNLADVNNIYIGFGIRGNTTTSGGSGKVFFDDITLYPTRCALSYRSDDFARVDYVRDCVVDYKEVKVMAESWLAVVPIKIDNPGFEDPVFADDDWDWSMDDEGWGFFDVSNDGEIGPWNPAAAEYPDEAPEGENIGWASPGGVGEPGGFAQVLTDADATLTADTTYTLTVEVGNAIGYYWGGYSVQLLAGGTPHTPGTGADYTGLVTGGTLLAEDNNSLTIATGTFETSTVTYTYDPAHSGLLGEPLQIRLLCLTYAGDETEADFDDVTLFHSPEPLTEIPRAAERRVDLYEDEKIDFKDFAVLAAWWLDEQLCP